MPRIAPTAILLLAIFTSVARADNTVVRTFSKGTGIGQVGIVDRGNDTPIWGPQALVSGLDNQILVLDQVNGRILRFRLNDPDQSVEVLRLPGGINATDLVSVGEQLFVWDEHPIPIAPVGTQTPGDPSALIATTATPNMNAAYSTFAQMGSVSLGSPSDVLRSVNAATAPNAAETQWAFSPSIGEISAEVRRHPDFHGADVAIHASGQKTAPLSLTIETSDQLGILETLALDNQQRSYFLVENISDDPQRPSSLSVARYDVKGSLDKLFILPRSEEAARRFVTVTNAGDVLFMYTGGDQVQVLKIEPSEPSAGSKIGVKFSALGQPVPAEAPIEETLALVAPRTRDQIVSAALPFETAVWTVSPPAYGPDPDHQCKGFSDRVRRPWYLQGHINGSLTGLPYCWGCKYSVDRFTVAVRGGKLAGNICTKEDPRSDAAGVDCSGFVSETWGMAGHFTTDKIPTISDEIKPTELRPGDVLNKPGSHVMLFLRFTPAGRIEVIQSATNDCGGRVCRRQYVLTSLVNSGYKPRKAKFVTDQ